MRPARIVIVGSFNADLTTYMKRMPKPGETISGDRFGSVDRGAAPGAQDLQHL